MSSAPAPVPASAPVRAAAQGVSPFSHNLHLNGDKNVIQISNSRLAPRKKEEANCAKTELNWTLLDRFNDASPYTCPRQGSGRGERGCDSLLRFAQNANLNSFQLLLLLFHLHFGTNTRRLGRTEHTNTHTDTHTVTHNEDITTLNNIR